MDLPWFIDKFLGDGVTTNRGGVPMRRPHKDVQTNDGGNKNLYINV